MTIAIKTLQRLARTRGVMHTTATKHAVAAIVKSTQADTEIIVRIPVPRGPVSAQNKRSCGMTRQHAAPSRSRLRIEIDW